MSALRRDLVERKLWMLVALLVVAVVGVPVFLLKSASASSSPTVPAPPVATPAGTQTSTTHKVDSKKESPKVVLARMRQEGFISPAAEQGANAARVRMTSAPHLADAHSGYAKDDTRFAGAGKICGEDRRRGQSPLRAL